MTFLLDWKNIFVNFYKFAKFVKIEKREVYILNLYIIKFIEDKSNTQNRKPRFNYIIIIILLINLFFINKRFKSLINSEKFENKTERVIIVYNKY